MKRINRSTAIAGLAAICFASCFAVAQTDQPATPPAEKPAAPAYDGPSAEVIMEKYIEATGGRAAYEKLTNRITVGTLDIPMQGLKGQTTMTQAAPNKLAMTMDLGPIGNQRQGFDGNVAWSVDTMSGARVVDGVDRENLARQARFNAELAWKEMYKDVQAVAQVDIEGKPAYQLDMSTPDGQRVSNFYDKESGLLLMTKTMVKSQMGEVPMESFYSDYREADGVKIPHKTLIKAAMGMEITMTIESVKHNVEMPANTFDVPAEVQKILDASKPATP